MKIGLIQIDGTLPNLAVMQIAAYHREVGDDIEFVRLNAHRLRGKQRKKSFEVGLFDSFDKVYASVLFSFNLDLLADIKRAFPGVISGGTGIDYDNRLPVQIASIDPGNAWFLYPEFQSHLGFSMKGCRYKCDFCGVPIKEPGKPWSNASIAEVMTNPNGGDRLILLDNDFFGGPNWKANIEEIIRLQLKVSFCQGLNIRIITEKQAEMLAETKFHNATFTKRQVTFAWDRMFDEHLIKRGLERCAKAGIRYDEMAFFLFVGHNTTEAQDLYRIEFLDALGCDPFVMPKDRSDPYQNRIARWVNQKAVFNTVKWQDYKGPITKGQIANKTNRFELPVLPGFTNDIVQIKQGVSAEGE